MGFRQARQCWRSCGPRSNVRVWRRVTDHFTGEHGSRKLRHKKTREFWMDHVYPPGPATVPPNLTAATAAYKHRAWLAMGGLAAVHRAVFRVVRLVRLDRLAPVQRHVRPGRQLRPLAVRRCGLRRIPRGVHAQGAVLHPASLRHRRHRDHARRTSRDCSNSSTGSPTRRVRRALTRSTSRRA